MEIKDYKAPRAEVIEVNMQNVLCQSNVTGGFGLSNGDVGRGDDSDWD